MCMVCMYVNICVYRGECTSTITTDGVRGQDSLRCCPPGPPCLRESLSSAVVQLGNRELVYITLIIGSWGSQMHYCFRHYIGSRDSNSGPPSCIASALFTEFVKQTRLVSQQPPGIHQYTPPSTRIASMCHHTWLFKVGARIKDRSLIMQGKYFTF